MILDHLFPVRCVSCGAPVAGGTPAPPAAPPPCRAGGVSLRRRRSRVRRPPVCADCLSRLLPSSGPRCRSCGVPLVSELERCVRCRSRELHYGSHRAVFAYVGVARRLIAAYKFAGRRSLGPLLCEFLAGALQHPPGPDRGTPVLVPVPASRRGRRVRGFDQVERLATVLERSHGFTVARVLNRGRAGEQKTLDFAGRSRNLAGAVGVRRGSGLHGRRVILIDDVFTTGATINECARVLLEAGACRVDAVTLAAD